MASRGFESPISARERRLINAAEDVLARWAVVRATHGKLGDAGLAKALDAMDVVCEEYEPEEMA